MDRFHIAVWEPSLHTQIQDKECAKSRAFVSNLRVVFLQMLETLSQWENQVIMKLNMKLIAPNAARHLTTSLHNSPEILETSTECVLARHTTRLGAKWDF